MRRCTKIDKYEVCVLIRCIMSDQTGRLSWPANLGEEVDNVCSRGRRRVGQLLRPGQVLLELLLLLLYCVHNNVSIWKSDQMPESQNLTQVQLKSVWREPRFWPQQQQQQQQHPAAAAETGKNSTTYIFRLYLFDAGGWISSPFRFFAHEMPLNAQVYCNKPKETLLCLDYTCNKSALCQVGKAENYHGYQQQVFKTCCFIFQDAFSFEMYYMY